MLLVDDGSSPEWAGISLVIKRRFFFLGIPCDFFSTKSFVLLGGVRGAFVEPPMVSTAVAWSSFCMARRRGWCCVVDKNCNHFQNESSAYF